MSSLVPVESKVIWAWFVGGKLAPLSEENVEKRRYWVLIPTGISRDQMTQTLPCFVLATDGLPSFIVWATISWGFQIRVPSVRPTMISLDPVRLVCQARRAVPLPKTARDAEVSWFGSSLVSRYLCDQPVVLL